MGGNQTEKGGDGQHFLPMFLKSDRHLEREGTIELTERERDRARGLLGLGFLTGEC